ncbi:hypothetical protein [Levilactobacillus namurensis]|uniref:Uncharacterized protein n=1 Tax=Levilactobacillus namurensis TaxID=380393 RepID=A0AAW8WAN6_9LACO|nr:hypothetical protein [Levilactobacillus namurensis]MDT7015371.1 hypothetical protein [Levilactobacillus namurensis]
MATPNVGILTTTGKALIDKVNSGQAKISFSKVVFSSMDNSQLSDTQIKALTAIAPQEVVVSSPQTTLDTNSGETRIRATGTNEKLADGVYVKTYGVFAKDDTGNEILYGVTVSPNPNYFPAYDGVTPQAVTYSYKTVIQETSNITMTNSNDVYASQEDLTEALQPYAKTVDVNQQLDKKVNIADMRKPASDVAGIEEVNAKQDKIGYTPADDSKVVHDNGNGTIEVNGNSILPSNDSILRRIDGLYTDMNNVPIGWWYLNGWSTPSTSISNWGLPKAFYYVHCFTTSYGLPTAIQAAYDVASNNVYVRTMSNFKWNSWKLTADDSKVVHTADMRKPASDVAGIEEVNAKQDKLTITPADDSKVVHTSDTSNWQKQKMFNPGSYMVASTRGAKLDFYDLLTQKYTTAGVYYIRDDDAVIDSVVISEGNGWWYAYGVNYAGNFYHRKIATTTNPVTDTGWVLNADDSKVVHLSGANNFDTTPTVNNNPLLLASSLPSDLARTGQDANFTGKLQQNGQDVALANNTIARNPNTGVVSEPVDFTKLTVNGGKSVATSDDLKSVEDASWHTMTGKSDSLSAYTCMYRKNNEQKYVDLVLYGTMGITMGTSYHSKELLDLSEIISSPKNVEGNIAYPAHAANGAGVAGYVSVSGTKILFSWESNNSALYAGSPIVSTGTSLNSPFLRVTFD